MLRTGGCKTDGWVGTRNMMLQLVGLPARGIGLRGATSLGHMAGSERLVLFAHRAAVLGLLRCRVAGIAAVSRHRRLLCRPCTLAHCLTSAPGESPGHGLQRGLAS